MKGGDQPNLITETPDIRKKGSRAYFSAVIFLIFMWIFSPDTSVSAESASALPDSAVAFYETYGSQAVFIPDGEETGWICFGTKAYSGDSNSTIHYSTVGWKLVFTDKNGSVKQTIFMKLGGDMLESRKEEQRYSYYYRLYAASWSGIRDRLTTSNQKLLEAGKLYLHLDACLVVSDENGPGGSMSADGKLEGRVYTSYQGIAGACNWGKKTLDSLKEYFDRKVSGLFFTVSLSGDEGIRTLTGAGNYCYGSQVEIRADTKTGYQFTGWTGSRKANSNPVVITISGNLTLKAESRRLHPPVVEAWDRYYFAEAAETGRITEQEILSHYHFTDIEDGTLSGKIEGTFRLNIPGEGESCAVTGITVYASDSDGACTRKEVNIYLYRREIKKGSELTGTIRFVSRAYYENSDSVPVPESAGGLMENSIWIRNPEYRKLLRSLLE